MRANYGYADGSGDYFITIDTDRCDGCGACVDACPRALFEVQLDDYDEDKAIVKPELTRSLGTLCPGHDRCARDVTTCQQVCEPGAITHSW